MIATAELDRIHAELDALLEPGEHRREAAVRPRGNAPAARTLSRAAVENQRLRQRLARLESIDLVGLRRALTRLRAERLSPLVRALVREAGRCAGLPDGWAGEEAS